MIPSVAIVIPVYNKCGTVARSIKSARAQTIKNIEIVIVDDGSTDCSKKAVLEAIEGDSRCSYAYQENGGVATARTNGVLNHTTAPYVMCLDSDDAIEPKYLEHLVPHLIVHRTIGIVYTGLRYILPDGKTGTSPWPTDFDAERQMHGLNQIPTAAVTRREVWERLGGQRQRYAPGGAGAEDGDFWLRAVSYGFGALYVPPKRDTFFVYSWMSGLVSGDSGYNEVDYRQWSPWARDYSLMPTPSRAKPKLFSHPARQYDEPVISVIIPVGPGHERYLEDCLDSLDAQTFKRWEAIVIFDVPGTEWADLVNSGRLDFIAKTWPFCRFMSTASKGKLARELTDTLDIYEGKRGLLASLPARLAKPAGAGAARNAGLQRARAPLVLFLDADDWLVPSALKKMVGVYKETGDIVYTDHLALAYIKEEDLGRVDGEVLDYNQKKGQALIRQGVSDYKCERAMQQPPTDGTAPYIICSVSALMPRKYALGGFDESMKSWEDVLFFWRLAWEGRCFTRIPEPLLVYRYSTGTRRELGLKNIKPLLKYLSEQSEMVKKMGCNCGKNKMQQVTVHESESGGEEMINLSLSRGGTLRVADYDVVLVEFNPPDRGSKMRYGLHDFGYGSIKYGYFGGGETFYVHIKDIEADKVVAKAQNREPMFIQIKMHEDSIVEEPDAVQELEEPVSLEELNVAVGDTTEVFNEMADALAPVPEAATSVSETLAEFSDLFEGVEFPDPVENKRLVALADLDYGDELKNPQIFIPRLHSAQIFNSMDILEYEREHANGLQEIQGIGPKARRVFVEAAERASGL
jgi:glycosyltransferase involved in cell wall biosynthesis